MSRGDGGAPRHFRAQSVVEFAVVSLLFFPMLLGVVEGGYWYFAYHQVQNAAREGARFAIASGSQADAPVSTSAPVQAYVRSLRLGIDTSRLMVAARWPGHESDADPECSGAKNQPGCRVVVTATYAFRPIVGIIFGTGTIPMRATSEMRIHY